METCRTLSYMKYLTVSVNVSEWVSITVNVSDQKNKLVSRKSSNIKCNYKRTKSTTCRSLMNKLINCHTIPGLKHSLSCRHMKIIKFPGTNSNFTSSHYSAVDYFPITARHRVFYSLLITTLHNVFAFASNLQLIKKYPPALNRRWSLEIIIKSSSVFLMVCNGGLVERIVLNGFLFLLWSNRIFFQLWSPTHERRPYCMLVLCNRNSLMERLRWYSWRQFQILSY